MTTVNPDTQAVIDLPPRAVDKHASRHGTGVQYVKGVGRNKIKPNAVTKS